MLLTLIKKRKEADDAYSFIFEPSESIMWRAGQYMFYTLPNDNPDNRGATRYFTISSSPFEKNVMITTRIDKPGSSTFKKSLTEMKIGETIQASGPDGDFIISDPNRNYVFIAGGIGITPFRSILLDLYHRKLPINVQLMYANRDKNIVFKDELESLISKNPNFKIQYFINPTHIDEKAFLTFNSQLSTLNFYISGPSPFVRSIRDLLKEQGALSENIKLDFFPGYES
ncbi:MAG: hypothetical protein A2860_02620 [Candidatus Levybacteria bacterium RIFCSPHIGHO2_01_FULL_37_33]|nr:MAG: hypothetical protein A2860_02620 [Candidatus Levybacteria bacterium RIFCSPHIGHO2_01_FULL_37_33]OGH15605.1 MAG: hypothetical protein A3C97_01300 [Candidatus Levybacteria bacterium RIFCSPHIGHO2_02_FULL_37_11]OGH30033.1 MAG: hypothetical protein A3F30_03575 [Candidatus Levybacteria bacterium RIFCSPHIGHO2_12_FULL_37_12]OGH33035.1 MAG: hypothetical protein A2953_00140 [Candidatus Levybacteria bacterium RIFCSPLOWO2_01_FULL_36_54]